MSEATTELIERRKIFVNKFWNCRSEMVRQRPWGHVNTENWEKYRVSLGNLTLKGRGWFSTPKMHNPLEAVGVLCCPCRRRNGRLRWRWSGRGWRCSVRTATSISAARCWLIPTCCATWSGRWTSARRLAPSSTDSSRRTPDSTSRSRPSAARFAPSNAASSRWSATDDRFSLERLHISEPRQCILSLPSDHTSFCTAHVPRRRHYVTFESKINKTP